MFLAPSSYPERSAQADRSPTFDTGAGESDIRMVFRPVEIGMAAPVHCPGSGFTFTNRGASRKRVGVTFTGHYEAIPGTYLEFAP